MWKEGKKDSSVRKQTYTVLLNSTTPTQEISEVRHSKSHVKVLKKSSRTVLYTSIQLTFFHSYSYSITKGEESQGPVLTKCQCLYNLSLQKEQKLILPTHPLHCSLSRTRNPAPSSPTPALSQGSSPSLWSPLLHPCVAGFVDDDSLSSLIYIVVHPKIGSYPV